MDIRIHGRCSVRRARSWDTQHARYWKPGCRKRTARLAVSRTHPGQKALRFKERAFHSESAYACDVFSVNAEIDRKYTLAPLDLARALFKRPESATRFELGLAEMQTNRKLLS